MSTITLILKCPVRVWCVGFACANLMLTAPLAAAGHSSSPRADLVVIDKGSRTLKVFSAGQELASFNVALGREPGKKECKGDNKTPEGAYTISGRNENSDYHRALRISYPSAVDATNAKAKDCRPGGDIMIHGLRNDLGWVGRLHSAVNWTRGCIAVTNEEIEEIWNLVPDGARVEIKP